MNQRTPEPHEELIGYLLNNPTAIKSYPFDASLFKEYGGLYSALTKTDAANTFILKRRLPQFAEMITQLSAGTEHVTDSIVPHLIETVKGNALKVNIARLCRDIGEKVPTANPDELLREFQTAAMSLETSEFGGLHNPEKDVNEYMEHLEAVMNDPSIGFGLLTGLKDLDAITKGWQRQDFSVVGARTSMGKSAFAIANVLYLNEAGYKCAIFSLEMSKRQIYNRMVANLTGFDIEAVTTGKLEKDNFAKVKALKPKLAQIYVDDSRGVSADYIVDTMRKLKRTQGLDFVLVDYIQDVKEPGEQNDNGGSAISRTCRKLRKGAKDMDCHVQGLSQVDRSVEKRENKRPNISDLLGSTGIETSADVIAMLYRDDYYAKTDKQVLEVIVGKQRNGKLGTVELAYLKNNQRVLGLKRDERSGSKSAP